MPKVIALKVENIKGVQAIEITPDPNVVKLSGDNGAGKSTIMDSIAYAIGGKRLIPEQPLRKGKDEGEISVELETLKVIRQFKRKDGGYTTRLKVIAKDGHTLRNPQEVLNELIGQLTFDPMEFCEMSEREQYEVMQKLIDLGFDPEEWQAEYERLYDKRHEAGRDMRSVERNLENLTYDKDAPDELVSVSKLTDELNQALQAEDAFRELQREANHKAEKQNEAARYLDDITGEIAELEKKLIELKTKREVFNTETLPKIAEQFKVADKAMMEAKKQLPDIDDIQRKLADSEAINERIRQKKRWHEIKAEAKAKREAHEDIERELHAHEKKKRDAIEAAKFPVDGLAFGDNLLLYNGIPVKQASDGEQIKISALIGMAMNPELRVLFIRKASLISDKNFVVIDELAHEHDFQVWLEYVDTSGEIGIYIEDGMVKA